MINLNLNKKDKYILTCSFGPDSMCLFDLLLKGGYEFVVAHVNYHLRFEEPKEVETLQELCKKNNIKLFIKDFYMPKNANEEGWAREVRYNWFSDLGHELGIQNILTAHNEDDNIETYILQKRRGGIVSYFGMKEVVDFKGVKIIRPLLNIGKENLLSYCKENNVPFGIDQSNFDTKFLRNKIRKNIVSKLTQDERQNILLEIKKENEVLTQEEKIYDKVINGKSLETCSLLRLDNEKIHKCVVYYLNRKGIDLPISKGFIGELINIFHTKETWHKEYKNGLIMMLYDGKFGVYKIKQNLESYIKVNSESAKVKNLDISNTKIVCGPSPTWGVEIVNGTKKIRRCFIDWKVPYLYRKIWPVLLNENSEVLYIPHYKKDFKKEENSILEFNIEDLFE